MDGRRSTLYAASQTARIQSLAPLHASLPASAAEAGSVCNLFLWWPAAAPAPLIYLLSKPGSGSKRGPPWAIGANALASQPCFARSPTRRPCCFTLPSFVPSSLGRHRMATDEWESTRSPSTLGTPLGSRRPKCIETLAALR